MNPEELLKKIREASDGKDWVEVTKIAEVVLTSEEANPLQIIEATAYATAACGQQDDWDRIWMWVGRAWKKSFPDENKEAAMETNWIESHHFVGQEWLRERDFPEEYEIATLGDANFACIPQMNWSGILWWAERVWEQDFYKEHKHAAVIAAALATDAYADQEDWNNVQCWADRIWKNSFQKENKLAAMQAASNFIIACAKQKDWEGVLKWANFAWTPQFPEKNRKAAVLSAAKATTACVEAQNWEDVLEWANFAWTPPFPNENKRAAVRAAANATTACLELAKINSDFVRQHLDCTILWALLAWNQDFYEHNTIAARIAAANAAAACAKIEDLDNSLMWSKRVWAVEPSEKDWWGMKFEYLNKVEAVENYRRDPERFQIHVIKNMCKMEMLSFIHRDDFLDLVKEKAVQVAAISTIACANQEKWESVLLWAHLAWKEGFPIENKKEALTAAMNAAEALVNIGLLGEDLLSWANRAWVDGFPEANKHAAVRIAYCASEACMMMRFEDALMWAMRAWTEGFPQEDKVAAVGAAANAFFASRNLGIANPQEWFARVWTYPAENKEAALKTLIVATRDPQEINAFLKEIAQVNEWFSTRGLEFWNISHCLLKILLGVPLSPYFPMWLRELLTTLTDSLLSPLLLDLPPRVGLLTLRFQLSHLIQKVDLPPQWPTLEDIFPNLQKKISKPAPRWLVDRYEDLAKAYLGNEILRAPQPSTSPKPEELKDVQEEGEFLLAQGSDLLLHKLQKKEYVFAKGLLEWHWWLAASFNREVDTLLRILSLLASWGKETWLRSLEIPTKLQALPQDSPLTVLLQASLPLWDTVPTLKDYEVALGRIQETFFTLIQSQKRDPQAMTLATGIVLRKLFAQFLHLSWNQFDKRQATAEEVKERVERVHRLLTLQGVLETPRDSGATPPLPAGEVPPALPEKAQPTAVDAPQAPSNGVWLALTSPPHDDEAARLLQVFNPKEAVQVRALQLATLQGAYAAWQKALPRTAGSARGGDNVSPRAFPVGCATPSTRSPLQEATESLLELVPEGEWSEDTVLVGGGVFHDVLATVGLLRAGTPLTLVPSLSTYTTLRARARQVNKGFQGSGTVLAVVAGDLGAYLQAVLAWFTSLPGEVNKRLVLYLQDPLSSKGCKPWKGIQGLEAVQVIYDKEGRIKTEVLRWEKGENGAAPMLTPEPNKALTPDMVLWLVHGEFAQGSGTIPWRDSHYRFGLSEAPTLRLGKLLSGEFDLPWPSGPALRVNLERCRVVVSGACDAGRTGEELGEDLGGLSQAWLGAGVPAVVSPVWESLVGEEQDRNRWVVMLEALGRGASPRQAVAEAVEEAKEGGEAFERWANWSVRGAGLDRLPWTWSR
jgi:hypothetical protein